MDSKRAKDGSDLQLRVQEEPQVVAEFHITSPEERNELLAMEYNSCPLCGSELTFTHVTHFTQLQTEEDGFCYTCNISAIKQTHSLQ